MADAASESLQAQTFMIDNLPLELRELIWEFTLPHGRVFHIQRVSRATPVEHDGQRETFFHFYINHPHPVALHVCGESRATALRRGFFLLSRLQNPGPWFDPVSDILYIDRNQRELLQRPTGFDPLRVAGLDRVLNVGIEWRAFFRDVPFSFKEPGMSTYWKRAIEPLCRSMPSLRTINYILPQVRQKGGVSWGRVPFRSEIFEAQLVPLPLETHIPWEARRNTAGAVTPAGGADQGTILHSQLLRPWLEIQREIQEAFDEIVGAVEVDATRVTSPNHTPSQVLGWWLLRVGTPVDYGTPEARAFFE